MGMERMREWMWMEDECCGGHGRWPRLQEPGAEWAASLVNIYSVNAVFAMLMVWWWHACLACMLSGIQPGKQTDRLTGRQAGSQPFWIWDLPFSPPTLLPCFLCCTPPHLPSPPPTAVNKAFQNNNEFCWKCIGMILLCSKKFDCKWQVHSNEPTNRWTNKGTDRQIKEQRDRQTKGLTKGRTAAASAMNYEQRICCVRPVGQKVHLSNVTEVELRFSVFA